MALASGGWTAAMEQTACEGSPMSEKSTSPVVMAGATLSVIVTLVLNPAPFTPISTLVGVLLVMLLVGYELRSSRDGYQTAAFAGVLAVALLVAGGWLLERAPEGAPQSSIGTLRLLAIWLPLTLACAAADRLVVQRRRRRRAPAPTPPAPGRRRAPLRAGSRHSLVGGSKMWRRKPPCS